MWNHSFLLRTRWKKADERLQPEQWTTITVLKTPGPFEDVSVVEHLSCNKKKKSIIRCEIRGKFLGNVTFTQALFIFSGYLWPFTPLYLSVVTNCNGGEGLKHTHTHHSWAHADSIHSLIHPPCLEEFTLFAPLAFTTATAETIVGHHKVDLCLRGMPVRRARKDRRLYRISLTTGGRFQSACRPASIWLHFN